MITQVDICNMAMGRLGISRFISSIDERSNEARICKQFYDIVRDRTLTKTTPGFANCYADLQDIGTPPDEWAYRYRYPSDCLKLLKIMYLVDSSVTYYDSYGNPTYPLPLPTIPHEIVADEPSNSLAILTNISPIRAKYTKRVTNEVLFSQAFINAFAWGLAVELAAPLSASPNYASQATVAFNLAVSEAIADSQNEQSQEQQPESAFITARY